MKNVLHRVFSVSLALLLLASTTSWRVEKHFCMGHLVDIALFSNAKSCGMDMENDPISEQEEFMSCCSQEVIIVDGQDNLKLSFNDFNFDQQVFLVAITNYYFDLFEEPSQLKILLSHYPPPILTKDIHILDQVFLI